ncbi:hypothetical protein AB0C34_17390 [Nocardia sp. NPDC049220]|uniref:hypothetical protein n=1 Tax=Nocardia sp. NPDC049220 TaxID=3155273 RepID=UPI0033EF5B48
MRPLSHHLTGTHPALEATLAAAAVAVTGCASTEVLGPTPTAAAATALYTLAAAAFWVRGLLIWRAHRHLRARHRRILEQLTTLLDGDDSIALDLGGDRILTIWVDPTATIALGSYWRAILGHHAPRAYLLYGAFTIHTPAPDPWSAARLYRLHPHRPLHTFLAAADHPHTGGPTPVGAVHLAEHADLDYLHTVLTAATAVNATPQP